MEIKKMRKLSKGNRIVVIKYYFPFGWELIEENKVLLKFNSREEVNRFIAYCVSDGWKIEKI